MAILKYWKLILVLLLIGGSAFAGAKLTSYKYQRDISRLERLHLEEEKMIADELHAAYRTQSVLQSDLDRIVVEMSDLRDRKQQVVERIINKEVIKYVQKPDAGKCDIPHDLVRIHDSAASGVRIPEAPSDTDVTPRGITDIDLAIIIPTNYAICRSNANKLKSLQLWVKGVTKDGKK